MSLHFQLKLRDVALESQRCVAVICVALQFTDREVYLCIFYACSGLVLHKHERHQCSSLTEQMKHFSVSICRSDHTTEALWLFRTSAYNNYTYYLEKYSPLSTPAHQTTAAAAATTKLKTGLYKSRGNKR